jgi:GNAT superfamily N-acetyltransferase
VSARAWQAGPEEAEAVARLVVGFRDHMGKGWPSENAMLAGVERLMEDRDTVYLLASPDDDSPPAGYAQLRFRHSLWTAAPDCWVEDVFVEDSARRRGVGDALVALALQVARERGARRAELDTSEGNEGARALYARHGFSESSKGEGRDLFLGVTLEE